MPLLHRLLEAAEGGGRNGSVIEISILLALASLGFRVTRTGQMVNQYSWLYVRAGGLAWRERTDGRGSNAASA